MTGSLLLAAGSVLDADPAALLEVAADAGFDGVGLRPSPELLASPAHARSLRRRAADLGLRIHDVEVIRLGGAPESIPPLIETAAELGAHAVLVVSDLPDPQATLDGLGAVVEQCRLVGLVAAVEYMAWTTPSLPLDAIDVATAADAVVVADLLHHHRVGAGVTELEAVVASGRLGWVQLCDAPAAAPLDLLHEARHDRLLPGTGGLPLDDLLAVIPADTVISVEVQSDRLAAEYQPAERARRLADAARAVLSRRG